MRATSSVWRTLPTRRVCERRSTWSPAVVHFDGHAQNVIIRDMSRGGMKIEFAYGLMPGDRIRVELASGRMLEATVMWSVAAFCGVEFPSMLEEDDPAIASCKRH
jgi:PilZ domain